MRSIKACSLWLVPLVFSITGIGTANSQNADPIRLGLIVPVTGAQSALGGYHRDGTQAAVDFINSKGGVLGRKLELVMRDSQFQPANAAAAARDLLQQNVVAVMGDISATTAASEYAIMNQAGIPMFTPAPAKKDLDAKINPMLFATGGAGEYIAWNATSYLVDVLSLKKICTIGDLQNVPRFEPMARDFLTPKGIAPLASQSFAGTATDISVQLKTLKDAGCEGLMVWAFGPPLVTVVRGLQAIDWHPPAAGTPGIADAGLIESVGPEALKNFFAHMPSRNFLVKAESDPPNPIIKDFVVWYGKLSPKLNGVQQAIYAWNNVEILAKAIEKAGKAEPAAIVKAMESGMPIETVGGTFTYSASDHTGLPLSALGMAQGGARISANGTWLAAPGLLR